MAVVGVNHLIPLLLNMARYPDANRPVSQMAHCQLHQAWLISIGKCMLMQQKGGHHERENQFSAKVFENDPKDLANKSWAALQTFCVQ